MRTFASLLAVAVLAACVPPPENGPGGVETLTGRVSVVGSAPVNVRVSFQADDGRSVYLAGPLTAELRQLAGAHLEVEGSMVAGELVPTAYRIRSVDGRPVWQGVVETAPAGGLQLRLEDGTAVRLGGAADHLRPGQKVWVQGTQAVQVQTFGVITP